jgi:hypothetical protein
MRKPGCPSFFIEPTKRAPAPRDLPVSRPISHSQDRNRAWITGAAGNFSSLSHGRRNRGFSPTGIRRCPSLHFHSVKGRFSRGMSEVADFPAPVFTAVDAIVLYFQSTVIFPSWTSRVTEPPPRIERPAQPAAALPPPCASHRLRAGAWRSRRGHVVSPPSGALARVLAFATLPVGVSSSVVGRALRGSECLLDTATNVGPFSTGREGLAGSLIR